MIGGRVMRLCEASSYCRKEDLVGKSMAHVRKLVVGKGDTAREEITGDDAEVYDKWSQAVASSYQLIQESGQTVPSTDFTEIAATAVLPILVVSNGSLWTVDYAADGQRIGDPAAVESCRYFLGKSMQRSDGSIYNFSDLFVYTRSGFEGFIKSIATERQHTLSDDDWNLIFPHDAIEHACRQRFGAVRL